MFSQGNIFVEVSLSTKITNVFTSWKLPAVIGFPELHWYVVVTNKPYKDMEWMVVGLLFWLSQKETSEACNLVGLALSRVYDRERVSNIGILCIRCMRRVTWLPVSWNLHTDQSKRGWCNLLSSAYIWCTVYAYVWYSFPYHILLAEWSKHYYFINDL